MLRDDEAPSKGPLQVDDGADLRLPETFQDGQPLPKMIIFDIDYTLWPFWVDTHVTTPLKPVADGTYVLDRTGESFSFYDEVPAILHAAREKQIPMALASRTQTPGIATQLLSMLTVPSPPGSRLEPMRALDFFKYREIYPGDKRTHMKNLRKSAEVDFEDMLFFDDERRNSNVESLGVCFWLVKDGISTAEVDAGLKEWRRRSRLRDG